MQRIVSKTNATCQLMVSGLQEYDPRQVIDEVLSRANDNYPTMMISFRSGVDSAIIRGDELIEHLVWNLIENAYEHNPQDDKQLWLSLESMQTGYQLSVADNGPGIPDDVKTTCLIRPVGRGD